MCFSTGSTWYGWAMWVTISIIIRAALPKGQGHTVHHLYRRNTHTMAIMQSLHEIEGVAGVYAQKLKDCGCGSPKRFLDHCGTPKGRKDMAAETGISETLLLKWANRVDLSRVKGVGEEYSDLLEAAGVDTVPELAQRIPAHLFPKMVEVNTAKQLVRKLPTQNQVADWISQAKHLPRILQY